jgi:EAL domain-containing protein (putative c-di-GMP-specific phosphodiesterase class I)
VLELALAEAARWQGEGRELDVSVNLAAPNLLDERLVDDIGHALVAAGVEPARLRLELTETMIVADPPRARAALSALAELGCALALDDFGTGYSSLEHLRELPIDEIKIDRSFVQALTSDAATSAIVESTIQLARRLQLRVVAEGVEEPQTLSRLRLLGCEAAQGYLIARPMPVAAVPSWLDAGPADLAA